MAKTSWEQFLESIGKRPEPVVGKPKTDREIREEANRKTITDWKKPEVSKG